MLTNLGVAKDFEGIVALRVYKAQRLYREPGVINLHAPGLDGAWLSVGELPAEYHQLRLLHEAQRNAIVGGFLTGRSFADYLQSALKDDSGQNAWRGRPMALLVGWRAASVRHRTPTADYDWIDLAREYGRGLQLRTDIQTALGRLGAGLAVGLDDLVMDQVASHSFWTAPGRPPVVVLGDLQGSAEGFTRRDEPFPTVELTSWTARLAALPDELYDDIADALQLIGAAKASEAGWLRFTLGWAALERLASNVGSRFDNQIDVETRPCPSCGADITRRTPTLRPRLEQLANAVKLPDVPHFRRELKRLNDQRGRTHHGALPDQALLTMPERLATDLVHAILVAPERLALQSD